MFFLCGCFNKTKEKQEDFTNPLGSVIIDATQVKETNTPLRLSQFADSILYIALSEYDSLNQIMYTSISIIDDTIFLDNSNLHKYTPEGKFIKFFFDTKQSRIETRKMLTKISAINKEERYITIRTYTVSNNRTIIKNKNYSYDGVFVGENEDGTENSYKEIEAYFNNYRIYIIDTLISASKKINRLGAFLFYVENMKTDTVFYSYPNPASEESFPFKHNSGIFPGNMNFIRIDSVLWYKHFVIDTLYSTKDFVTRQPRYIFKTDKTFMSLSDYTQLKNGLFDDDKVNKLKFIWGILPLPATGDLLFTINRRIVMTDKNGNTTGYALQHVINDIDEYLKDIDIASYIIGRTFYIENNYLYLLVGADRFFKEGCKPPFENLTEKSAPIVLKIKLKS